MLAVLLQYGEFRSGYADDKEDTRIVFYGLRYILETYLLRQWTVDDVEKSAIFYQCVLRSSTPGLARSANFGNLGC